jgi:hypothetical protein
MLAEALGVPASGATPPRRAIVAEALAGFVDEQRSGRR